MVQSPTALLCGVARTRPLLGGYGFLDLFLGLRDPDGAWEVQAFAKI
jgi:hypothetical protein